MMNWLPAEFSLNLSSRYHQASLWLAQLFWSTETNDGTDLDCLYQLPHTLSEFYGTQKYLSLYLLLSLLFFYFFAAGNTDANWSRCTQKSPKRTLLSTRRCVLVRLKLCLKCLHHVHFRDPIQACLAIFFSVRRWKVCQISLRNNHSRKHCENGLWLYG